MGEISAHFDHEANALQIALEPSYRVDRTTEEGGRNHVNLDWQDDRVVGIEVLNPTKPLWLARIAAEHDFAHLLDDIYAVATNATSVSIGGTGSLTVTEAWWPGVRRAMSAHDRFLAYAFAALAIAGIVIGRGDALV